MKLGKIILGTALLFATGQFANAELLMLLEGDVESGSVAVDSSGKGNHGLYLGSAGQTAEGRTGGALNFNADESYMLTHRAEVGASSLAASASTPVDAFAGISDSQSFSIGFWVAGGDTNPRNSSVFWARGVEGETNRAIQAHSTWSNSQIYLDIGGCCDGDTQRTNGPLDEEHIKASVGDEWSHLTFTAGIEDEIAFRRIYVNGEVFLESEASADNAFIPLIDKFNIASDNNEANQWEGRMDDFFVTDNQLTPDEVFSVYDTSAREFFGIEGTPDPVSAQFLINNETTGVHTIAGEVTNVVKGEPTLTQGLLQHWYDANLRANPEAFLEAGDEGSEAAPLVAEPFAAAQTWWAGGQNVNVISDVELERYPQSGLAGTRFEGNGNADNYAVRLTGEIFIAEDGEYLLRDGIDDYTMIAIDQDGNGELDGVADLFNGDVGAGPFDDVLVNDDDWANIDGGNQAAEFHGIAEMENIDGDGEWRKIEIWMSEGGGGDAGIVYMGNLDDDEIFDDLNGDALSQEEIDKFVIPFENLRSVASVVESADSAGALGSTEYVFQVGMDGNDSIEIANNGGVFNTTLDVSGATLTIDAMEGIEDGSEFQILNASNIVGTESLTINADGFDTSRISEGIICFGSCGGGGGLPGDVDGDGSVAFADFLILSNSFGTMVDPNTNGDLDGDGSVAFADFLILSNNFGATAAAASVPEPSGLALAFAAFLFAGLGRKRR